MGGGGGGGSSVQMRNPSQEKGTVGNWYDFQNNQYQNYVQSNPLLKTSQEGSLGFWGGLPGMLGQFPGFQNQLSGYQSQLGNLLGTAQNQIGGYQGQLGNLYGQLGKQAGTLGGWLGGPSGISATIASHGALTGPDKRNANQEILQGVADQGGAQSNASVLQQALNRQEYQRQRFNTALQQGQGLVGQQAGLYGQQAGIAGQGAGLTGMLASLGQGTIGEQAGLTGQQAGLLGQEQGLQTGGLNQLLGVQNAATQNFTGLTNPILGYLGNLFGGNQQASIDNAQIQAQQQQAGNSKTSGLIGGGASLIGSVAVAY